MVPRTHDTLATLGQHGGMTGQNELIATSNEKTATRRKAVSEQKWLPEKVATAIKDVVLTTPEVVQHANSIEKPDLKKLESQYGLKICTAMLNVSAFVGDRWRYREIYIHSKLMLVDDLYFTLGSANLNQRSMAVDSEINLVSVNPQLVQRLRRRIWGGSWRKCY
ncbi:MAG: phospholipase D-like domain-containing protein [Telluria sp.]